MLGRLQADQSRTCINLDLHMHVLGTVKLHDIGRTCTLRPLLFSMKRYRHAADDKILHTRVRDIDSTHDS